MLPSFSRVFVPFLAAFGITVIGLSDPGVNDLSIVGMPGCGLRAALDILAAHHRLAASGLLAALAPGAVVGSRADRSCCAVARGEAERVRRGVDDEALLVEAKAEQCAAGRQRQ